MRTAFAGPGRQQWARGRRVEAKAISQRASLKIGPQQGGNIQQGGEAIKGKGKDGGKAAKGKGKEGGRDGGKAKGKGRESERRSAWEGRKVKDEPQVEQESWLCGYCLHMNTDPCSVKCKECKQKKAAEEIEKGI